MSAKKTNRKTNKRTQVNKTNKNKAQIPILQRQARNWCFTDFELLDLEKVYNDNKDLIRYLCFGTEICPNTKKTHYQGWIQFFSHKRGKIVQKILGSTKLHIEVMLKPEINNDKYCKKDNNFKVYGSFITSGFRSDIEQVKQKLLNDEKLLTIANEHTEVFYKYKSGIMTHRALIQQDKAKEFRKLRVIVLEGKTGEGKTRLAMENCTYKTEGSKLDWWDGYDADKSICIDEYANQIPITDLLNILDGYTLRLPIKGGFTYAYWDTVYLTTNLKFALWYPNANTEHRKALLRRITSWLCLENGTKTEMIDILKDNLNNPVTWDEVDD